MSRIMFIFAALTLPVSIWAEGDYFQQRVKYDIKADLDPESAVIAGIETITYFNNSPDTLGEIYFHLYYNAFQPGSYLAERDREFGDFRLSELSAKNKGYVEIDMLKADGIEYDDYVIDNTIMKVPLVSALAPGDSMVFYIEYRSQIPVRGSRAGHRGKHFDVGQWYPKPAVYDRYGWHHHQYLDFEFYADYADFDVELTLPSEYIVAHMGKLLNEEEMYGGLLPVAEGDSILVDVLSLMKKETPEEISGDSAKIDDAEPEGQDIIEDDGVETKPEPETEAIADTSAAGKNLKTWKFRAENVHDFAFCADPKFIMDICGYNGITIKSYYSKTGKKRWARNGAKYTRQAIALYSEKYYPYPYDQYTTVATIVTSGGMEYPQLTMIGARSGSRGEQYLYMESVIAHEVAHAWFYGILGFNETEQSYLDEGLTSFATMVYLEEYYGREHNNFAYKKSWQRKFLPNGNERNDGQKRYISRALLNNEDPMNTQANLFMGGRYYNASYEKAQSVYLMLQYVMGEEKFDRFMGLLFERWALKHPYLSDVQGLAEEVYGQKLGWFFHQWFDTTWKLDYALERVRSKKETVGGQNGYATTVELRRKRRCVSPLDIVFSLADGSQDTAYIPVDVWLDGAARFDTTVFLRSKPRKTTINPDGSLAEISRFNNSTGLPPVYRQFMIPEFIYKDNYVENYVGKYTVAHHPLLWYNSVDGAKPGYRIDGSFLGLTKSLELEGSAGLNNAHVNYLARYSDRMMAVDPDLQYYLGSMELEGRGAQDAGVFWEGGSRYQGRSIRVDLSLRRHYLYDRSYFYGGGWSSGDINTVELYLNRYLRKRRSKINLEVGLVSSIPGGSYNFTRSSGRLELTLSGIAGYDTRLEMAAGISNGNVPYERRFFLSSASPYEIWNSPLFRSRGTLPDRWKDDGRLFLPGGGGLYGYLDRGMTGTRMIAARLERDLPQIGLPVNIPYLSGQIERVNPEIYAASGIVWDKSTRIDINDFLSEAGLVLTYEVPYLDMFISESNVKLYMPLWVSEPTEGEEDLEWRWLFSITP